VGSPDPGRSAEQVRVTLQLPVAAPEHVSGEHDAGVGGAPHLTDVVVGVRRAADDHQLHAAGPSLVDPAERLDQQVRVVLGLQPADEQDVAPQLEAELLERPAAVVPGVLHAVGDDADPPAVAPLERVGDGVAVGDRPISEAGRGALGEAQVGLGQRRPLLAVGIESVDVDQGRDPGGPGDPAQRRVPGDEEQRDVRAGDPRGVHRRQQRVDERVQVLVLDRRQVHQPSALV